MKLKEKDILKFGTKSEVKFLAEAGWMNQKKMNGLILKHQK